MAQWLLMQSVLMPCLEIQGEERGNLWQPHNPVSMISVVREIREGRDSVDGGCLAISTRILEGLIYIKYSILGNSCSNIRGHPLLNKTHTHVSVEDLASFQLGSKILNYGVFCDAFPNPCIYIKCLDAILDSLLEKHSRLSEERSSAVSNVHVGIWR